jgi:hypothetical protein
MWSFPHSFPHFDFGISALNVGSEHLFFVKTAFLWVGINRRANWLFFGE